ncbi:MAG: 6-hydroxymethylpterin diphosphokinase MptE-like protein [Spirochaetales bacterium]
MNGKALFSAYDPEKEATRWIGSLELAPTGTLFLLGDAGGYLEAAVAVHSPSVRVVSLVPEKTGSASQEWSWWPGKQPLATFLEAVLEKTGPASCRWQVWPAFERAAPSECLEWTSTFRDVFRTVQGSWLTWKHSGTRWWRNALRNAAGWESAVTPVAGTRPIVVAASGPTLQDGLEVLRRCRSSFDLWALPSSFEALRLRGLEPDVGITTDGGFYAREHLRRLAGGKAQVVSALSGAPDSLLEARPTAFFGQGLPWETEILSQFPLPPTQVPSQGTVAVTALHWAQALTSGPVLVAGLDLAFRDFRAHVSGHTVDRRLASAVGRLSPWEALWAERYFSQATLEVAPGVHTSPAMRTYALWLGAQPRFARPLLRLAPTQVTWPGTQPLEWNALAELAVEGSGQPVTWSAVQGWPSRTDRVTRLRAMLVRWRTRLLAGQMTKETLRRWSETAQPDLLQAHLTAASSPRPADLDLAGPLAEFLSTLEVR